MMAINTRAMSSFFLPRLKPRNKPNSWINETVDKGVASKNKNASERFSAIPSKRPVIFCSFIGLPCPGPGSKRYRAPVSM